MKQHQVIKVPTPLHTQFKALAAKRGVTMVDLVHGVVRDAIKAGELPDEVPGFRVAANLDNKSIEFTTNSGILAVLTPEQAEGIADTIRHLADKSQVGSRASEPVSDDHGLSIRNVGTGIVFDRIDNMTDASLRSVTTPAHALDIARSLESSAKLIAGWQ